MKAIVGIGLPGSGKTSRLKELALQLQAIYICPDDIRLELTGDTINHEREGEVWATAYSRISKALTKQDIVFDATSANPGFRKELIKVCLDAGADKIEGYWFCAPLHICRKNNLGRERQVPDEIMVEMDRMLQEAPPSLKDGFSVIYEIPLKTPEKNLNELS
jgi:predicted kinase